MGRPSSVQTGALVIRNFRSFAGSFVFLATGLDDWLKTQYYSVMSVAARLFLASVPGLRADVWPAHALGSSAQEVLSTGDPLLDAALPGGGWPLGALIEILQPQGVHNEWRLLLPALMRSGRGPVVLVGAPYLPFAPALGAQGLSVQRLLRVDTALAAERLWACEQALCCADVDAVLGWLPQVRSAQLRRLHMAAAGHGKLLFVMRAQTAQQEASPAPLRLQVQPQPQPQPDAHPASDALQLDLFKRRGPPLSAALALVARPARMRRLLALGAHDALDRTAAPL